MIDKKSPPSPIKLIAITAGCTLVFVGIIIASLFAFSAISLGRHNNVTTTTADTEGPSATENTSNPSQSTISIQQEPQLPACTTYQPIDSRAWLEIAKDPHSHAGECIVIYGKVTQFDSATGTDNFRADVGGTQETPTYGFVSYPTNTVLAGSSAMLSDVVEDDLFTANVMVLGSYTYSTQIGGQTTVPRLQVDSVRVTGSLNS